MEVEDWMEHGERQYLVGEMELDGKNEREERMEEESSSSEEINDAPSSPVTLERLSVEEQEIWTDIFEGIETKEDGQPDSPPALQLPLEEEVYDEVYEPEEAEHSGMKTPVEEDHSQREEEDEIEGAEAIGEEAVVIWTEGPDGNESENDEEELEGMAHIVEKEDGSFTVNYILPERGPLLAILDGDEEEHTYSDGDDSEGTIAWDSEDDVEENADGISDGDESDGTIFLDSDDDDVDMKMAEPKLENGPTGQEKKNTVEQTVDLDDVLMDGVINGLKKLEQEKARQQKASQQKVVVEEEEEQRPFTSHQLAVRDSPQPSTSRQLAHRPLLDLDDDSDEESETGDEPSSPSHNDLTRPAAGKKPQYCRKCGNHGLRRLKNECGEWQSVGKDELKFIRGCLKKKCHCPKCEKVDREREAASKRRKAKKDEQRRS